MLVEDAFYWVLISWHLPGVQAEYLTAPSEKRGLDTEMEILAVGRWLQHPEVIEPKTWTGY